MRVLIVTQYYPPEPVPIPAQLANDLVSRGHSVRVITGFPNYPGGSIIDGYRQRWRSREDDGEVRVQRVPLYADHSQNAIKRLLNYVTFALSSASARSFGRGADVVYVYATQMTAALGPWIWRMSGGAPYLLHVQDLWPDSVVGSNLVEPGRAGKIISRALDPWLRSVYRRAGAVVGIAPTMVRTLVARGVEPRRAHLVYNWADELGRAEVTSPVRRSTTILYAGNVGQMQDLDTAVRAAHAAADAGVVLRIVGDGSMRAELEALVDDLQCRNVEFQPPVARERMGEVYARADFGLVSLKDLPAFRGTIPSKLQGLLAAGVPVITTVVGDASSIIDRSQVGLVAQPQDVESLEAAFRSAAQLTASQRRDMSQAALDVHRELFSRDAGVAALERILKSIVKRTGDTE